MRLKDDVDTGHFNAGGAFADHMANLPPEAWKGRSEPMPKGKLVWATDGESVWLLEGTGKPIDPRATAVRAWTEALIPKPPKMPSVAGRPSGKAD